MSDDGSDELVLTGPLDDANLTAARRELYAFVQTYGQRRLAEDALRKYALEHLGGGDDRRGLTRQIAGLFTSLEHDGRLTSEAIAVTSSGAEDRARLYISSHLTQGLKELLTTTVVWAVTGSGRCDVPAAGAVCSSAEYAAFTHQRAFLELLGHDGGSQAQDARRLLGLASADARARARAAVPAKWMAELNRAVSHIATRHLAPTPPAGASAQDRVAWLTARTLFLWRAAGDEVDEHLRSTWDAALANAERVAGGVLEDLGRSPTLVDWNDENDPFNSWQGKGRCTEHWWPREIS